MSRKKLTGNIGFGESLSNLRRNKGLEQSEFAEKIGFSQGYISLIEKGKKLPSKRFIKAIENYWGDTTNSKNDLAQTGDNGDFAYIPAVRGKLGAGGGLEPDNAIEMKIAFRKDWIMRHGDPGKMSLIRIQGDSMEPTLHSGDWVLIDHQRNYVDMHGGIYAIAVNGGVIIKRVQMNSRTKKMKVISDNGKYEPIEFEEAEIIVNGKMIWFCREVER